MRQVLFLPLFEATNVLLSASVVGIGLGVLFRLAQDDSVVEQQGVKAALQERRTNIGPGAAAPEPMRLLNGRWRVSILCR